MQDSMPKLPGQSRARQPDQLYEYRVKVVLYHWLIDLSCRFQDDHSKQHGRNKVTRFSPFYTDHLLHLSR